MGVTDINTTYLADTSKRRLNDYFAQPVSPNQKLHSSIGPHQVPNIYSLNLEFIINGRNISPILEEDCTKPCEYWNFNLKTGEFVVGNVKGQKELNNIKIACWTYLHDNKYV